MSGPQYKARCSATALQAPSSCKVSPPERERISGQMNLCLHISRKNLISLLCAGGADTRSWHSNAANLSDHDRVAVVCRYVPWWLSAMEFGSGPCRTYVPRDTWSSFPPELQLLYRHVAEGVDDYLQPDNQHSARRAMFQDQPELRGEELGDNGHVAVGEMSAEEWLRLHDIARL
jgi:hypothetical protein